MGKDLVDIYTFGHFVAGLLSQTLVSTSTNLSLTSNFVITNLFHIFIEFLEKDKNKNDEIVETFKNHISDIIIFIIGWLVSYYNNIKVSDKYIGILWSVLIIGTIKEVFRENFI
jgi:hypothetical protein